MSKTEHQEPLVSEYKPQFYTEPPDNGYVSDMDSGDTEDLVVWFNKKD